MPRRAPDDALPCNGLCFMNRTATGEKRHVFLLTITVRVSLNPSYFNNLFLWRTVEFFLNKCIHNCTLKVVLNRPMFSYTDAGRCPYDMWPHKRKFLKIVQCPGDYQIRRWCAKPWNLTMSVLFVTIAWAKNMAMLHSFNVNITKSWLVSNTLSQCKSISLCIIPLTVNHDHL